MNKLNWKQFSQDRNKTTYSKSLLKGLRGSSVSRVYLAANLRLNFALSKYSHVRERCPTLIQEVNYISFHFVSTSSKLIRLSALLQLLPTCFFVGKVPEEVKTNRVFYDTKEGFIDWANVDPFLTEYAKVVTP